MATRKTFHKFSHEDLEVHKDLLLRRSEELGDTKDLIAGLHAKAAWLKSNLAGSGQED